jgi:spermidine synthase
MFTPAKRSAAYADIGSRAVSRCAGRLGRSGNNRRVKARAPSLPEVNFSDQGGVRYLHLGTEWVQGSMLLDRPFEIELEYVQRMMAWLLFARPETVSRRHAMQLGLGAASLTKFCYKKLRMKTTAIELNPQVIAACRIWFKLPADDARLSVILGDAAEVAAHEHWRGSVDALQVDLYDQEAAAPVLDSPDFYAGCRQLLTEDGCMTVNLFGRSSSYAQSLQKIVAVFGPDAVWAFRPTREGNTIVLALRTPQQPGRVVLAERAETIETRWGLPARKWLRVFKPVNPPAS